MRVLRVSALGRSSSAKPDLTNPGPGDWGAGAETLRCCSLVARDSITVAFVWAFATNLNIEVCFFPLQVIPLTVAWFLANDDVKSPELSFFLVVQLAASLWHAVMRTPLVRCPSLLGQHNFF